MICDVIEGPQKETTECPGGAVSLSPGDPGFWGEREHLDWNMDAPTPSLFLCASVFISLLYVNYCRGRATATVTPICEYICCAQA